VHGQNSKGFTLIELMVVIGVIAILTAVAMPSYRDLMDNYRVRQAGEDVISLIANARTGAVKLHRQVNVSFTTGASWCAGANAAVEPTGGALAGAAAPCDCANPSTCVLGAERVVIPSGKHPGVTMATASNALTFNGISGVTTPLGGGTVTLTSPLNKFTATVTVTPLGQSNLVVTGNN